jgi:uncharacterized membrane protein YgcG
MYSVSNDYIAQLHKSVFKFDLEGRLTNTGNFYADNILAGSLSITNQCASGNKIIMGSVYIGELKATFVDTADIAVGDTITLSESMYVDELDSYESVPLGAYKVVQSTKSRSGIEVIAYDYMSKFDKPAELAEVDGTVFEWLRYCCSMCNVTMAQTQAQIEALPNGTVQFRCYLADGFKCTYRDVVSWLAQIIGGFATMDRQGRVKLVTYEQLTTVNTIYSGDRYNDYSFGLNTTLWDAIKYTYIAGGGEEERVVGTPTSEETTFDFGANPFLQADDVATNHALTRLLDVVENMVFVPFKVRVASGACYDLGDTVRMHGGSAPNPLTSVYCITNLEWHYNGGTVLGGAGGNTAIGSGGSSGGSSGGGGGTGGGGGHTYNDFEGATSSADGTHGLVPAPLIADKDKFLCGDGSWKAVQSGAGERELTEAEYEALSYAEKMNGTTYYITNMIGASGVNGSSPLVDYANPTASDVKFYGSTTYTATENCYISFYIVLPTNNAVYIDIDGTHVGVYYGGGVAGDTIGYYLQAGQTITVSGANNAYDSNYFIFPLLGNNYSTTEHKTGRKWIDGKDIWEVVGVFPSRITIDAGQWANTPIPNTGKDTIIYVMAIDQSGTCWNCVGANKDTGSYVQVYNARGSLIGIKQVILQYTKV